MRPDKRRFALLTLSIIFALAFSLANLPAVGEHLPQTEVLESPPVRQNELSASPTIDQAPTLVNPHDGDNMYPATNNYQIIVNVTDTDGCATIDHVDLYLYDDTIHTPIPGLIWGFRYYEDNDSFVELGGMFQSYVSLSGNSTVLYKLLFSLDIMFCINLDWGHTERTNSDTRVRVEDDNTNFASTYYETNWDIETDLDYYVTPSVTSDDGGTVDRGDLNEAFHLTGTIEYYGSASHVRPQLVDVWVSASQYGTNVGPWGDLLLTNGAFDVTCYADNLVGQDTYTVKLVENGAGSGGSDLYYTTSLTDTYIADRVQVQGYSVVDNRVSTGDNVNIDVTILYDYDNSPVADGTVTIEGQSASYRGSGEWRITDSEASYTSNTYDTVACSGNSHGMTGVDQNSQSQIVIWDSLTISITGPNDQRINVGANASGISVTAIRDYDGSTFDGSLTLNDTTYLYGTVGQRGYEVLTVSGGSYGITSIRVNDVTYCIWDRIIVQGYSFDDSRININTAASLHVTLEYEFNNAYVTTGTVTVNGITATYSGSNGVWNFGETKVSVTDATYNSVGISGDTYGLSVVNQNGQSQIQIWDALIASIYGPGDRRIDINTNCSGMYMDAIYDYDDTLFDGTLTLNDTTFIYATVSKHGYRVVSASGGSHGITAISSSNETNVIWDRIIITATTADDNRIGWGSSTMIMVYGELEYADWGEPDHVLLGGGDSLYMNDTAMSWNGAEGRFELTVGPYNMVGALTYFVNSSGAYQNEYGISAFNLNGQFTTVIWDRIRILTTTATDDRINYGSSTTISVTADLEYDGHPLGSGDTLYLNDTIMSWQTNQFELTTGTYSIVDIISYFVNSSSASETTYGITVVNTNGQQTNVIWDRILILTTTSDDSRIDYGTSANVRATAALEFDGHPLGSGDALYMNDIAMTWQTDHFELVDGPYSMVGDFRYYVNSSGANEVTYGISVVNLDGQQTDVIWDRIRILTTTASDTRVSFGTSTTISVTADLEYDGHIIGSGDTVYLNDTAMSWQTDHWELTTDAFDFVGALWFEANSSAESTYGISVMTLDGNGVSVIWDRLVVDIQADFESSGNGIQVDFSLMVTYDYDGVPCVTYLIQIDRNSTLWNAFTDSNKSLFFDSSTNNSYTYFASSVLESTYGLTAFVTNTEQVTWTKVVAPMIDVAPVLINPDDSSFLYARYRYYIITSNVSDQDGFGDIDQVLLMLFDNAQSTNYWTLRFDEDTNTFSIINGSSYVSVASWSSYEKSGTDLDIVWAIKIHWAHQDLNDIDIKQYVVDSIGAYDSNFYESNWDIETRLSVSSLDLEDGSGTPNRGDPNGAFSVIGTVIYFGSTNDIPLDNETEVWVSMSEYGTEVGPWSDLTLTNGEFNATAYADNEVGEDTLSVKIVDQGAGSGGASLLSTASQTSYITDQIQVQSYWIFDGRINVDGNARLSVQLYYAYDSSLVNDGTVTVSSLDTTYSGSEGNWNFTDAESTVTVNTYNLVSCLGNTHGITSTDQNGQSTSIIWDKLIVNIQANTEIPGEGQEVTFTLSVMFDYDNQPCTTYLIVIERNGTRWRSFTDSNKSSFTDSAIGVTYNYAVGGVTSESTHGVTAFDPITETVAWAGPVVTSPTTTTGPTGDGLDPTLTLVAGGGIGLVLILVIVSRMRPKRRVDKVLPPTDLEVARGGEIIGDTFEYKVKVVNKSDSVITNVTVTIIAYPEDCLLLDGSTLKKFGRIEPEGFRSPQFSFTPTKDCVSGQVLSTVSFVDHQNRTQVVKVEPYTIRSVCDLLTPLESSLDDFELSLMEMDTTSKTYSLGIAPEFLFLKAQKVLPGMNFYLVDAGETQEDGVYRATVRGFAKGKYTGSKVAIRIVITGDVGGSSVEITVEGLGEDEDMLPTTIEEIMEELEE